MITGSSTADVGLLLVPAEKGGFEAAIAKADRKLGIDEGQTRQHARLLYLLGVDQLIVGINKMDATMPPWSEDRFNEIKDEFSKTLQAIGYKPKKVPFIPYSGYDGDNLDKKTEKAPWYKGWVSKVLLFHNYYIYVSLNFLPRANFLFFCEFCIRIFV